MRNVLVVSSVADPPRELHAALGDDVGEIRVVAPAVEQSRLQWLTNAEDDARAEAERTAKEVASETEGEASAWRPRSATPTRCSPSRTPADVRCRRDRHRHAHRRGRVVARGGCGRDDRRPLPAVAGEDDRARLALASWGRLTSPAACRGRACGLVSDPAEVASLDCGSAMSLDGVPTRPGRRGRSAPMQIVVTSGGHPQSQPTSFLAGAPLRSIGGVHPRLAMPLRRSAEVAAEPPRRSSTATTEAAVPSSQNFPALGRDVDARLYALVADVDTRTRR